MPPGPGITREDFLGRLRAAHHTQSSFAALTGIPRNSVYQWGVRAEVPAWVPVLLDTIADRDRLRAAYDVALGNH